VIAEVQLLNQWSTWSAVYAIPNIIKEAGKSSAFIKIRKTQSNPNPSPES